MREDPWDTEDDATDDSEWSDDDDTLTIPCPYCGEEMLESAPQCPSCGNYLSDVDRPPERKPPWIMIGIIVCLIIALAWAAGM